MTTRDRQRERKRDKKDAENPGGQRSSSKT